jgi:type IV pilus assembly protein PilA
MQQLKLRCKQRGQGMTEYIIIVALIAIAAIGVYQAFGDVVRGQTGVAAAALNGSASDTARTTANNGSNDANQKATQKNLKNFEKGAATGG